MPNEGHIKILCFFPILINAKKPQQMKNIRRLVFTVCIQQQLLYFTCRTAALHLEKFGYAAYLQTDFPDIPRSLIFQVHLHKPVCLFITEQLKTHELYPFVRGNKIKITPKQFTRCHKREIMVQGRGEAGLITTMKSSFNIRDTPTTVTVKTNSRTSWRT